MAKTLLGSGFAPGTSVANTTQYWSIIGRNNAGNTTETNVQMLLRSPGTLSNLSGRMTANSLSGGNLTIRTRLNGANGGQSVSVSAGATGQFRDTTGTDTIAAADKVCIQTVPPSTGTFTFRQVGQLFDAITDTVTIVGLSGNSTGIGLATASVTRYASLGGSVVSFTDTTITETHAKTRLKAAGTFKNLCVRVTANARTTDTTFRGRKNGADGNLAIAVGSGITGWLEDTDSDTVAVDDDYNFSVTTGTGTQTLTLFNVRVDFVSTESKGISTSGYASSAQTFADNTITWAPLQGDMTSSSTESTPMMEAKEAFQFSNLICNLSQNGVSSASTLTLKRDTGGGGADTGLAASITGNTTGVFADTSDTVTVAAGDLLYYSVTVPTVAGSQTITIIWISIGTFISTAQQFNRTVTTENVSIGESAPTRLLSAARSPSTDGVTVGESLSRLKSAARSPSSDTVAIGESITVSITRIRATTPESTTVNESAPTRQLSAVRVPTPESVAITENLTRNTQAFRTVPSDAVTIGESLSGGKLLERAPSADAVTIAEPSLTRQLSAVRAPTVENITIGENLSRIKSAARTVSTADSVAIGEPSLTRSRSLARSPSADAVTIADISTTRQRSLARSPSTDIVSITENLARLLSASRTVLTDAVAITENLSGGKVIARTVPSDAVAITENLSRVKSAARTVPTDTVTLSENLSRLLSALRTVPIDNVPLGESLTRSLSLSRTVPLDATTIADASITRLLSLSRTVLIIDNVAISENLTGGVGGNNRSVFDSVAISESLTRSVQLTRTVPIDSITLSEQIIVRYLSLSRTVPLEGVSIADTTLTRLVSLARIVNDSIVAVADAALTRSTSLTRTVPIEPVNITENLIGYKTGPTQERSLFDTVVIGPDIISTVLQQISWIVANRQPYDWQNESPELLLSQLLQSPTNWISSMSPLVDELANDNISIRWDQYYDANADIFIMVGKGTENIRPAALGWTQFLEEYEIEVLITARSLVDLYDPQSTKTAEYYLDLIEAYIRKVVSINPSALEPAGVFNLRYTETFPYNMPRVIRDSNVTDVRSRIIRIKGDVLHGLLNRAP